MGSHRLLFYIVVDQRKALGIKKKKKTFRKKPNNQLTIIRVKNINNEVLILSVFLFPTPSHDPILCLLGLNQDPNKLHTLYWPVSLLSLF